MLLLLCSITSWLNGFFLEMMNGCLEVDSGNNTIIITRVAPEDLRDNEARFPCRVNIGPDSVRNLSGNEVPSSVYFGDTQHLTGFFMDLGDAATFFSTHSDIEGILIPSLFFTGNFQHRTPALPNIHLMKPPLFTTAASSFLVREGGREG